MARGVLGSVLVLLGGLITQVLPWSSPVAGAPVLEPLRDTTEGRMAGLVVVMAGLALLGSAWLRLLAVTHPYTGPDTGSATGQDPLDRLRVARTAGLVWSLPLLLAPPLFSRDGWSYAAQGAL